MGKRLSHLDRIIPKIFIPIWMRQELCKSICGDSRIKYSFCFRVKQERYAKRYVFRCDRRYAFVFILLSIMSTTWPVYIKRLLFWGDRCQRYESDGLKPDNDCFCYLGPEKMAFGRKIRLVISGNGSVFLCHFAKTAIIA